MTILERTQALIREKSVTPDPGNALGLVSHWLRELGFEVHELEFSDSEFPSVKNIYARRGTNGKNICFAGHTDVVPAGETSAWKHAPYEAVVADGVLYGRGAADMKGAIASYIGAVTGFMQSHTKDDYSLSFLLTGDEEGPAVNGTAKVLGWLKEKGERIDYCLVGEPTASHSAGDTIKVGRRGSMQCFVEVTGVQGHAAYPEKAVNPVPILVECIHAFESLSLDAGNEYFQPSNLETLDLQVGNDRDNVIPARASARLNVRFNSEHSSADIQNILESAAANVSDRVKLTYRVSGESFLTEDEILREAIVDAITDVVGKEPDCSTTGGTSDARFIHQHCPVIECGLVNATIHKVNEQVQVSELDILQNIYAAFLEKIAKN